MGRASPAARRPNSAGQPRASGRTVPVEAGRHHASAARARTIGRPDRAEGQAHRRPAGSTTRQRRRDRDDHGVAHADLRELLGAVERPARGRDDELAGASAVRFGPTRNSWIDTPLRRPPTRARRRRRAPTGPAARRRPASRCRGCRPACRRCGSAGEPTVRAAWASAGRRAARSGAASACTSGRRRVRSRRHRAPAPQLGDPAERDHSAGRRWPKLTSTMKSVPPASTWPSGVRQRRESVGQRGGHVDAHGGTTLQNAKAPIPPKGVVRSSRAG